MLNENLTLAIKTSAFLLNKDIIQHVDIRQHMEYNIKKFDIRRTAYEVY